MAEIAYPWLESYWLQFQLMGGRVPQALLIYGKPGLGKSTLGKLYAQHLLCCSEGEKPCGGCRACHLLTIGHHPGFFMCTPKDEESISIDQIRMLQAHVQQTVTIGSHKVVLINPIERLNRYAANALLKLLEEPPSGTYFIVISHAQNMILPTLMSRLIKMPIVVTDRSLVMSWLKSQNMMEEDALLALELTAYAPLAALALCKEGQIQQYDHLLIDLHVLCSSDPNLMELSRRWQQIPFFTLIVSLQQIFVWLVRSYIEDIPYLKPQWQSMIRSLCQKVDLITLNQWLDELNQTHMRVKQQYSFNQSYWIDKLITTLYFRGIL